MRTLVRISAAAVVLAAVAAGAQQKPSEPKPAPHQPNFNGRWEIVTPAASAGQQQIVTQDGNTLTTEHASEGGGHKMTYQLDGVERRMAIPGRAADITMLAKAAWDADRIVITTNIAYPNGMKTQSKEVWSIDAQGRLVIDYVESGPTGPGPSVTVIHVKKQ